MHDADFTKGFCGFSIVYYLYLYYLYIYVYVSVRYKNAHKTNDKQSILYCMSSQSILIFTLFFCHTLRIEIIIYVFGGAVPAT